MAKKYLKEKQEDSPFHISNFKLQYRAKGTSGDLVDTAEEFTRNATSKISIISQHIITTSDQEDELPSVSFRKDRLGNPDKKISHNLLERLYRSPPATRHSKNKYVQLPVNIEEISTRTSKKLKSDKIETKNKPRRRSNKLSKKHFDQEKNNLKATNLSLKYCLVCDRVQTNFRIHLQYNHKEVFRKATFMCDNCYKSFYFEVSKDNHNCD